MSTVSACPSGVRRQRTAMSPWGVGNAPVTRGSDPGCGAIRHVANPGAVGVTPSTRVEST